MNDFTYTDPENVIDTRVTEVPRGGTTVTGYGGKIPTRPHDRVPGGVAPGVRDDLREQRHSVRAGQGSARDAGRGHLGEIGEKLMREDDSKWVVAENAWDANWLDRNYDGAPDECGWHCRNGETVKFVKGECPKVNEHQGYSVF